MKIVFYKIECLTNLHVGSGDINYSIIDNEVEKDPATGFPVIHASGIKGALRIALSKSSDYSEDEINQIFGMPGDSDQGNSGSHKFLDATLISRPMRAHSLQDPPCFSVATIDSINFFLKKLMAFGHSLPTVNILENLNFGDYAFLADTTSDDLRIEGESTGKLPASFPISKLKGLFTYPCAIAKSFNGYDLPVIARNCRVEGKENLWYEEVVPHGSIFYFAVVHPSDSSSELKFPSIVQFGGNASIGYGLAKIEKLQTTN